MLSSSRLLIFIFFALSACATIEFNGPNAAWQESGSLRSGLAGFYPFEDEGRFRLDTVAAPVVPTGVLDLRQALALALTNNPELAASSWEVRVREAGRQQAGRIPNPEFELEVEEFGGSEERRNFDTAETTLQLSQDIELGRKRARRTAVADLETSLAAWDYAGKRLDVIAETSMAFLDVAMAQERLALSENVLAVAEQAREAVSNLVTAGSASQMDERRATIEILASEIDQERSRRELQVARQRLAATWGSTSPRFSSVAADFGPIMRVPPLQDLLQQGSENPDLARWPTEMDLRQAMVALERSENVPDVTASFGVTIFEETDDSAFVAGLSVPIPIFGLNPGGVRGARYQQEAGSEQRRAAETRVESELRQAYEDMSASYFAAMALSGDVIPAAEAVFDGVQQGYQEGRFELLQVLDAQRTLFEALGQHIDSVAAYHTTKFAIERLLGGPIPADPLKENEQ